MVHQHTSIVVYPSRVQLAGYALLYALIAVVGALPQIAALKGLSSLHSAPTLGWIAGESFALLLSVFGCLVDLLLLFTLYRLVVRKPSIIVSRSGIEDGCSLIVGGMGSVRWDEMTALYPLRWGSRGRHAYLVIVPAHEREVLNRRGPIIRVYLRIISLILPGSLGLPAWLFSMSVEEVYQHILNRHARSLTAQGIYFPTTRAKQVR